MNWLKDGSVISNQRVSTKHDGINYKLLINSVNAQDAGRYEIQAKNSDGQIKGEILVEVSKGKKCVLIDKAEFNDCFNHVLRN